MISFGQSSTNTFLSLGNQHQRDQISGQHFSSPRQVVFFRFLQFLGSLSLFAWFSLTFVADELPATDGGGVLSIWVDVSQFIVIWNCKGKKINESVQNDGIVSQYTLMWKERCNRNRNTYFKIIFLRQQRFQNFETSNQNYCLCFKSLNFNFSFSFLMIFTKLHKCTVSN